MQLPYDLMKLEWRQRPPDHSREHELLVLLRSHATRESDVLAGYRELAERSDNAGVRYLAQKILEDEERHHQMLAEMVNMLWSQIDEIAHRPRTPFLPGSTDPDTYRLLGELLDFERQDAKELRRLRRQLRKSPRSSLLPVIASMLTHDTAKHINMLRYIRANTLPRKSSWARPSGDADGGVAEPADDEPRATA